MIIEEISEFLTSFMHFIKIKFSSGHDKYYIHYTHEMVIIKCDIMPEIVPYINKNKYTRDH